MSRSWKREGEHLLACMLFIKRQLFLFFNDQGDGVLGLMTLIHRGPGNRQPTEQKRHKSGKRTASRPSRKVMFIEVKPVFNSSISPIEGQYNPDLQVHPGYLLNMAEMPEEEKEKIRVRYLAIDSSYDLRAHDPISNDD